MRHLKIYETFKINETLTIYDVRKNLTELTFDAGWDGQRKTVKVDDVYDYKFDDKDNLKLYIKLEPNKYISDNIRIVIGRDINDIWMYYNSDGKSIDATILLATRSWLFSLKTYLEKK